MMWILCPGIMCRALCIKVLLEHTTPLKWNLSITVYNLHAQVGISIGGFKWENWKVVWCLLITLAEVARFILLQRTQLRRSTKTNRSVVNSIYLPVETLYSMQEVWTHVWNCYSIIWTVVCTVSIGRKNVLVIIKWTTFWTLVIRWLGKLMYLNVSPGKAGHGLLVTGKHQRIHSTWICKISNAEKYSMW